MSEIKAPEKSLNSLMNVKTFHLSFEAVSEGFLYKAEYVMASSVDFPFVIFFIEHKNLLSSSL